MRMNAFVLCSVLGLLSSMPALAQDSVNDGFCVPTVNASLFGGPSRMVAEAVDAYLQRASIPEEKAAMICAHPDDSMRIYHASRALYNGNQGGAGLLNNEVSVHVAGTVVEMRGCWVLLVDGGLVLRAEPLSPGFRQVGQRVEVTLNGPLDLKTECAPVASASYATLSDWRMQPTELASGFQLEVRRTLGDLGLNATVAIEGPMIVVSGIDGSDTAPLEDALGASLGMLMVSGEKDKVFLWPNERAAARE